MKCVALRGFYLADAAIAKGSEVDVPDHLVRQLELNGKIERAPAPPTTDALPYVQPDAPAKAGKSGKGKPMTTATAPALVPGAATQEKNHD